MLESRAKRPPHSERGRLSTPLPLAILGLGNELVQPAFQLTRGELRHRPSAERIPTRAFILDLSIATDRAGDFATR
jgi:hypothetical protein